MNQLVNLVKPFGKEFKNLKLVQRQHEIIDSMDFEPQFLWIFLKPSLKLKVLLKIVLSPYLIAYRFFL